MEWKEELIEHIEEYEKMEKYKLKSFDSRIAGHMVHMAENCLKRFKVSKEIIKNVKKKPATREEMLEWYKLFYLMRDDFGYNHWDGYMSKGFFGMQIMEEMFGFKRDEVEE